MVMKKREVKEIYPERYSFDANDAVRSGNPEVPYVWTCFNGIKLFVPYISITHCPKKIRTTDNKDNR